MFRSKFWNFDKSGLHMCSYGTQSAPVKSRTELLHTEAQYSNVEGDGTVPAESAKVRPLSSADLLTGAKFR